MNFPLCVGNYDLQISWLFYIFNSCFSTFYHILSVPQRSYSRAPSTGWWERKWRNGSDRPIVLPSYCHSDRIGKVPRGTFLKHTLTFSLEKVKFNIWDETSFERKVEPFSVFSSVDRTFYRLTQCSWVKLFINDWKWLEYLQDFNNYQVRRVDIQTNGRLLSISKFCLVVFMHAYTKESLIDSLFYLFLKMTTYFLKSYVLSSCSL